MRLNCAAGRIATHNWAKIWQYEHKGLVLTMTKPISKEEAFARLGSITREMHEAFAVLGGGSELHNVVEEFPNARERLTHVGMMTEKAANTVLNLVDAAKPECDDLSKRGEELSQSLTRMAASSDLTVERARALMGVCGKFAERTAAFADKQGSILSDIMMAPGFSGSVGSGYQKGDRHHQPDGAATGSAADRQRAEPGQGSCHRIYRRNPPVAGSTGQRNRACPG